MPKQDIFEIPVIDEKGKQVDTVSVTKEQLHERGMTRDSILHAVPCQMKDGKTKTIYLQKDCLLTAQIK